MGDGVHTGSTRHVGHYWPIVSAPGGCDNGEFGGRKIGRGNRNTRRIPAPAPLCPHKSHLLDRCTNPGRRRGKPATNGLGYGAAEFKLSATFPWGNRRFQKFARKLQKYKEFIIGR
jgi:hypothetical protein